MCWAATKSIFRNCLSNKHVPLIHWFVHRVEDNLLVLREGTQIPSFLNTVVFHWWAGTHTPRKIAAAPYNRTLQYSSVQAVDNRNNRNSKRKFICSNLFVVYILNIYWLFFSNKSHRRQYSMSSSKKFTCKGTLRKVFICLRPRTP